LGHGKDYAYPHDDPEHFLPQQYLPKSVLGTYFYNPSQVGYEAEISARLDRWRAAQRAALGITETETIPDLSEEEIREIKGKHKAS
jgi:putative ATPase